MDERQVSETIVRILQKRDGLRTQVQLVDGVTLSVVNIGWGYDSGSEVAHITTNISPEIEGEEVDFFHTNEVEALSDPETGAVIYRPKKRAVGG